MGKRRSSAQTRSPATIKALFCDLGNVLVTFQNRTDRLFTIAKMMNPSWGSPEGEATAKLIFLHRLAQMGIIDATDNGERRRWRLDIGEISQTQLHHAFIDAADVTRDQMPPDRFACAYNSHHTIIPETCALIRGLQQLGIVVVAATNGDSWAAGDLLELNAGIHFSERRVMSWQIGVKKPDSKFYHRCLTLAQRATDKWLNFTQCLYIDDIASYVEAYRELGGVGVCFDATIQPTSVLRRKLRELGLLPLAATIPPAREEQSC